MIKSVLLFIPDGIPSKQEDKSLQNGKLFVYCVETLEKLLYYLNNYNFDYVMSDFSSKDTTYGEIIQKIRSVNSNIQVLDVSSSRSGGPNEKGIFSNISRLISEYLDNTNICSHLNDTAEQVENPERPFLNVENLRLYLNDFDITVGNKSVRLNGKEHDILRILMSHPNSIVTTSELLHSIYKYSEAPDIGIIDVFICALRRKLHAVGARNMIGTVWGRGYMIGSLP